MHKTVRIIANMVRLSLTAKGQIGNLKGKGNILTEKILLKINFNQTTWYQQFRQSVVVQGLEVLFQIKRKFTIWNIKRKSIVG